MELSDWASTFFLGYLLFKLERIDSRQDKIELELSRVLTLLGQRLSDTPKLRDSAIAKIFDGLKRRSR
jgi:hypothetical protein